MSEGTLKQRLTLVCAQITPPGSSLSMANGSASSFCRAEGDAVPSNIFYHSRGNNNGVKFPVQSHLAERQRKTIRQPMWSD